MAIIRVLDHPAVPYIEVNPAGPGAIQWRLVDPTHIGPASDGVAGGLVRYPIDASPRRVRQAGEEAKERAQRAWDRWAAKPVGLQEITERLGVARATVDTWRTRNLLPDPDHVVGGRPAWEWMTIYDWAIRTGRHKPEVTVTQREREEAEIYRQLHPFGSRGVGPGDPVTYQP